jgi:hypothetical protein
MSNIYKRYHTPLFPSPLDGTVPENATTPPLFPSPLDGAVPEILLWPYVTLLPGHVTTPFSLPARWRWSFDLTWPFYLVTWPPLFLFPLDGAVPKILLWPHVTFLPGHVTSPFPPLEGATLDPIKGDGGRYASSYHLRTSVNIFDQLK